MLQTNLFAQCVVFDFYSKQSHSEMERKGHLCFFFLYGVALSCVCDLLTCNGRMAHEEHPPAPIPPTNTHTHVQLPMGILHTTGSSVFLWSSRPSATTYCYLSLWSWRLHYSVEYIGCIWRLPLERGFQILWQAFFFMHSDTFSRLMGSESANMWSYCQPCTHKREVWPQEVTCQDNANNVI